MFETLLFTLLPATPIPLDALGSVAGPQARFHVADDLARLLEEARASALAGDLEAARETWRRVLELDPENRAAHEGLGHKHYEGRWYETYAALSAARRAEARRMLEEHGLVRFEERWVPLTDRPFLRMGWVQESGRWMHPAEAQRVRSTAELAEKGW